jgi:predicted deacetylase
MFMDRVVKGFRDIWFIVLCLSGAVFSESPLNFIIRVDDIQCRNTTTVPRSITDFENAVAERGAKVSWAVIPHRLVESQNQDGILKEELIWSANRGHEIVMHGYTHICPLCGSSGHEMYCASNQQVLSHELQQELIRDGLKILSDSLDCRPVSFVPPGHHADGTTYQVLLEEDFQWLSSTGPTKTMIYDSLYNLAPHNEYTWYMSPGEYRTKLNQALADIAGRGESDGYYCLLLHDPFIRKGYEDGLVIDWTAELLDSLIIRYGRRLRFMTLSQASEAFTSPTSVDEEDFERPVAEFELFSNYPNPFNHSTKIRYHLPHRAMVDLSIYNIQGQCIAQLIHERLSAGYHLTTWSAQGISSGVYYMRLSAENEDSETVTHSITRRCILIK